MNKFLLFCLFFISFSGEICCKIEGKEEPFSSKEEDLELERQLKVLNKPPLQSFQKEDGSIIDCIDIYKQPAFDHPLLKNHQLQMQPSLSLLEKLSLEKADGPYEQDDDQGTHDTKSQFRGCPSGTVPIRRTQKEDLIKAKEVLSHYAPMSSGPPTGTNYAGISTPQDTKDEYSAGKVGFTPYNLTMMIAGQTSTASLRIGSGVDGPFNSVEYGYTFNEKLYGDRKARTFSLWTADGFQKTGCFNTLCQGFVQVSSLRHIGDELTDFAVSGGERKFMLFGIAKDPRTQNWWIIESLPSATNQWVGYWPKELFPNMNVFAKNVQVGGKVFNPSLEPSNTPMGSGYYAPGDFLKTCNADVKLIDSSWKYITAPRMQVLMDAPDLYKAEFLDDESLLFGGPDIGKR